jgi:poly(A) polymerase
MRLQNYLKKIPYLSLISLLARKKKVNIWLVGGFLRSIYLPYPSSEMSSIDFDFCVEKNAFSVAKEFAKKTSSKFIVLDERQASFRVILKRRGKIYTYDYTLMRGANLYEDLALRDFSINTLAVNLNNKRLRIIDYFGARKDLKKKVIRVIKEEVFFDDPLRILRGFTFMANYGFRIAKRTEDAMVKFKGFLKNVSGERINEELFKILSSPFSFRTIKKMSNLRIIDEVIPYLEKTRDIYQGAYHHLDVWQHSLETLRAFEFLSKKVSAENEDIYRYLNEELAQSRKRVQILKLACLLHDIGKPFAKKEKDKRTIFHTHEKIGRDLAEEIANNLRLSFREREVLKKSIYWHLRPGYLADAVKPSPRAVYRFFRDTEDEGVGVILLSLSDWRATRGPLTDEKRRIKHEKVMFGLIDYYFKEKKKVPLPKIVDGFWVMRRFKLPPSPLVGKILKKIKEEQALGEVSNKREAYHLACRIISKLNKK